MVLVDTSVWIDHFHRGEPRLEEVLHSGQVLTHPFVVGELACGNLRNRAEILGLLGALPSVKTATHEEVLLLLERESLYGTGLGYVDVHLLAACRIERMPLWTRDKSLLRTAESLGVAYDGSTTEDEQ